MDFIHYKPESDYHSDSETDLEEDETDNEREEGATGDYSHILQFTNNDAFEASAENNTNQPIVETTVDLSESNTTTQADNSKKKGLYNTEQIRLFIDLMQKGGITVPKAARQCKIPRSSAYVIMKEYKASNGNYLTELATKKKANRGTPAKLQPQHTEFLVRFFEENPSSTLETAREALSENFAGFTISLPCLWKHLIETCHISLKQASKYNSST